MEVFAGHYELPPAEHPNAKTSSAARQAVAGESESNAKCGGGAVNSGDGIGCSTGSIGDSEGIPQGRLSQSFREAVARPSWNRWNRKKVSPEHIHPDADWPSRSGSRGKIQRYHGIGKERNPRGSTANLAFAPVIDSAGAFNRAGLTDSTDLRIACNRRSVRGPPWHSL